MLKKGDEPPFLESIEEIGLNGLGGGAVVGLDELKKGSAGEILGSGAGVLVGEAGLHVFLEGKIEAELARVGKGQSGADAIGTLHAHALDGGGLDGRDHAADAKAGGDGEAGVDGNGEEEVGEDGDLVVVTL